MSKYRLSAGAFSDLRSIHAYVRRDSDERAERLIGTLRAAVRLIAERPMIGRSREEIAVGLRSFVSSSYVIYYRVAAGRVEIVRVLHGAMDAGAALGSGEDPQP